MSPIARRVSSTSVCVAAGTGSSSSSSAGEISGRTAPMRTSSMRVVSCVASALPTSRSWEGLSRFCMVILRGTSVCNDGQARLWHPEKVAAGYGGGMRATAAVVTRPTSKRRKKGDPQRGRPTVRRIARRG
ncbi:hypothetical protein BO443_40270 [Burkholderia orbicola]